jgi:hypothetical protein
MNDLLKQRIMRNLEDLDDERGYHILDYIEFLTSKYADRSNPSGLFAKITDTVEDTMRAGKLPLQAISGTMGLMDSAGKVMKGLAAAGEVVVGEAVRAAEDAGSVLSGDEGKQVSSPSDSEGKERGTSS